MFLRTCTKHIAHLVQHTWLKLTPIPEPGMGSAELGRKKKKKPPPKKVALCPLQGKELSGLTFRFLGAA